MKSASEIIGFHLPGEANGCFSNWYPAEFDYAGNHYVNSEQYMMFHKVMLGKRYDLADRIMGTSDPEKIRNYASADYYDNYKQVEPVWDKIRMHTVRQGVRAKFLQNSDLFEKLLATGNALLAECAGQDRNWGIGINLHNPAWKIVANWNGDNMLGVILMELREEFRAVLKTGGQLRYVDHRKSAPIAEWQMRPGALKRIPQYYRAVSNYEARLPVHAHDSFLYGGSFEIWEIAMGNNMGGGLPLSGFFEMKQEIYEIAERLS